MALDVVNIAARKFLQCHMPTEEEDYKWKMSEKKVNKKCEHN